MPTVTVHTPKWAFNPTLSLVSFNFMKVALLSCRAVAIGCKQPLLVLGPIASTPEDAAWAEGEFALLNAVLGALHALYQVRPPNPSHRALYSSHS